MHVVHEAAVRIFIEHISLVCIHVDHVGTILQSRNRAVSLADQLTSLLKLLLGETI